MNEGAAEIATNHSIFEQLKMVFRRNMRQYAILMALIAIVIIFQIATNGILLKPINVYRLIGQNSYILIMAIGMTLCILTGGNIDLSVGSIVAFVSACSALFSVMWGLPAGLSIVLGLFVGLLAGVWNGFWIAHIKIPSFIATLAGMLLFRGLNNLILNGETIPLPDLYITVASGSIPDFFASAGVQVPNFVTGSGVLHVTTIVIVLVASLILILFMLLDRKNKLAHGFMLGSSTAFIVKVVSLFLIINVFGLWLAAANGFPYVLFLLVTLIIIYSFIATKTVAGRHVYAVGGNEKAAALSGVDIKKVMFWVYANMGFLAGIAGIVFAGRLNAASPLAGKDFELDVIAACFIGGASMKGGEGTIIGAIIGGLIMGILNNGMSILGFNIFIQSVIKGLVLLIAVSFDVYSKSKTSTRASK
ncbi:multiple monosaccharide ABC transporter permease [Marispirochaeta sp.]|jgi:putative multiple sugar transport system permease protein|uniref:multiple monosaccharide ABC transporter permease n=1 Tax=Marispirochaeta sp. TaxID=2038653 RepID=UPI0029C944F8|nr:multiple monosaccharide ABC transporter permease [Marispirochaeta sp.]